MPDSKPYFITKYRHFCLFLVNVWIRKGKKVREDTMEVEEEALYFLKGNCFLLDINYFLC